MDYFILGKTGLKVSRTGFGALPVQRVDFAAANIILKRAFDSGINFFDTANMYTDSEEKIGFSLSEVRREIIIASKSGGKNKQEVLEHIDLSLKRMKTDYIDIYQLHNPSEVPDPNDKNSTYQALIEAKKVGKINHIGISLHKYGEAIKAVESGLYDTLQYPLSLISSEKELPIIELCKKHNVGLIAMKALCGGVITNAKAAFAFLRQFENIVPIWGIQKIEELEEILKYEQNLPVMDEELTSYIENQKKELAGEFCRGCGYCMPCPEGIPLSLAARMYYMLRRSPASMWTTKEWQGKMAKIDNCTNCGLCRTRCPYGLNVPSMIKRMYQDYKTFL